MTRVGSQRHSKNKKSVYNYQNCLSLIKLLLIMWWLFVAWKMCDISFYITKQCSGLYVHRKDTAAVLIIKIEARSPDHCCQWKTVSLTFFECMSVALLIRHAKRMRRVMLSSEDCLTLLYISTLYHKRHDFREKKNIIEQKIYVLCLSLKFLSEKSLILRRNQQDIILNEHRSSCKVPIILASC
jgi:hypothetical protein